MVLYKCLSDGPALVSGDRTNKKTPTAFFYIEFYGQMNDGFILESINMIDLKLDMNVHWMVTYKVGTFK